MRFNATLKLHLKTSGLKDIVNIITFLFTIKPQYFIVKFQSKNVVCVKLYMSITVTPKMSTATLRIYKFEDGSNFKSMCISIPEDDILSNIKFSNWKEETTQQKKKDPEKSSRLVVKIVSGEETKKIDLDSCSKEISKTNVFLNSLYIYNHSLVSKSTCSETADQPKINNPMVTPTEQYQSNDQGILQSYSLEFSNPFLEHSLKKVKENNARIMENINMLNRTLNYTKKKEILDIIGPKSIRTFPCNACGKCFVYETGLRRHYAMRHAIAETQPRWQVVWTCIQCFQVWPRQDQALEHSVECCKSLTNQECVREIKTSLLLQCEFCEKVYTSIPRLLRHSKIHTTASNYECNSCGLAFVSYKMAEVHWPLCPWLNAHYCFSLSKMLLCNACDRKFRSYEQLYNHRYKVGHFMTKTHSTIGSVKTLGMLVYQCELCAQWYNSIPHIISHRSQHHPHNDPPIFTNIENNAVANVNNDNYYTPSSDGFFNLN